MSFSKLFIIIFIYTVKMSTSSEVEGTESEANEYYLELSPEPVKFEPVNDVTDVFFDDSKQQVRTTLNTSLKFFIKKIIKSIKSYLIYILGICN